ncbi:low-density lipoprotein receptor-related protein 3 isoform X1 [Phyllopteryx taeniolatus]|uniref:low-density lipoprotein receptor-related protein 3 isoform X1 n=1 Tax=Phyllopteryx taeniolatus TaxID=161469 RepID=UPI002AD35DDD|nr:low-density lipoprotein receptor-related protein 3 isoform X1 [Phyllopteryx taeniolatus]
MGETVRLGMLVVLVLSCTAVLRSAGCGERVEVHMERRGVIFSPSWPLNYPVGLNCSWTIQAGHGEIITISFRVFDVGGPGSCESGDWLLMTSSGWGSGGQDSQRLCGSTRPPPFITSRGRAWLFFHSKVNGSGQAQGFHMSYIKGHLGQSSCQPDEFLCGNGKCVPHSWKCNGQDECGDATDERGCSPPLTEAPPGPCPRGTLPCASGRSTRCLAAALRCDHSQDCPDGSDELGCPDTACGKHLGHFYGSFASPDFFSSTPESVAELRCSWVVDTRDPKPILLRLDLRLGPGDALHVYDGTLHRAENLLQVLSYHNNRRPTLLESSRGQMSVLYTAKLQSPGHGFNATYQVKGYCFPGERPCGSEQGCYSERQRCDGYWHCPSGRDEASCPACPDGEFPCGGDVADACYPPSERCNNQKRCLDGSDENNCYDCQPGNFHCGDNLCIFETWRCDGQEDCPDGSDEHDCPTAVPRKVITAALIGSLVCGLLLVVALGCALKLHALRGHEYRAFETQMSRMEAEFVQREAPPSYGQLIAQGLIPPVEDFPAYNPTQASVLQNIRLAMSRQLRRHTSRRSLGSSSLRRPFGHLWHRLFRREGRPRGHVPLLDPPVSTHVNLGLHSYQTGGGNVDVEPDRGNSEGTDPGCTSESPASPLSFQSGDSPEGTALSPEVPGPSDVSGPPPLTGPHPRSSRKLVLDLALNLKGVSLRRYSPLGSLSPANSLATATLPHPLGSVPPSSSSSEGDADSRTAEMRCREKRKRRRRKRRFGDDPLGQQTTPC